MASETCSPAPGRLPRFLPVVSGCPPPPTLGTCQDTLCQLGTLLQPRDRMLQAEALRPVSTLVADKRFSTLPLEWNFCRSPCRRQAWIWRRWRRLSRQLRATSTTAQLTQRCSLWPGEGTDAADLVGAGSAQGQDFQLPSCYLICFPLHLVCFI